MQIRKSILTLLLYFFYSCLTYSQNTIDFASDSICVNCDSTINLKLILNHSESIISNLDKSFLNKINTSKAITKKFPSVFYKNVDETQYLKIVNSAGADGSGCSYFEIGYIRSKRKENYVGKSKSKCFVTESGVKLGMSLLEFSILKGKQYRLFSCENGVDVFYYRYGHQLYMTKITIDDPIYIAIYKFKNDKLISFGFGYLPVIPD